MGVITCKIVSKRNLDESSRIMQHKMRLVAKPYVHRKRVYYDKKLAQDCATWTTIADCWKNYHQNMRLHHVNVYAALRNGKNDGWLYGKRNHKPYVLPEI